MTRLSDGFRVDKDSPYIAALGEVEVLNCMLGVLASKELDIELRDSISRIQNDLIDLGSELSRPGKIFLKSIGLVNLNQDIQRLAQGLPPIHDLIVPGGSDAGAYCYLVRATCRSVERSMVSLETVDPVPSSAKLQYLDRLSDFLFVLARVLNRNAGQPERYWSSSEVQIPSGHESG